MTAAVPFPLPPGRVLSAWRRDLAAYRPRSLRLAHLLLHRVEALVRVARPQTIPPFQAALLRRLSGGATTEELGLDRALAGRWLKELTAAGLVERAESGWRLTETGRRALDAGAHPEVGEERRAFVFLDESDPNRLPHFLSLHGLNALLAPPPGWRFDPAALEDCVRRSAEWKARQGFPQEVEAVVAPVDAKGQPATDWRRVILDRPEQIVLVFVRAEDAVSPHWLGFAARPEDWALQTAAAALTLQPGEVLPELADEPSSEAWREAWHGWCVGRGQPAAGADACRLEPLEDRVRVIAPRALAGRLGAERNDAWLLAGSGRVRVAASLEIVEGE